MSSFQESSFHHLHFEILESTHLWCKQQTKNLEELLLTYDYVIVSAHTQTHGIGRLAKPWLSRPGNIAFNLNLIDPICSDPCAYSRSIEIPCAASWAISNCLKQLGASCFIKWPNDIMTLKGKIGGCIVERYTNNLKPWISLGIGLNIYSPIADNTLDQPVDALSSYGIKPDATVWTEHLAQAVFTQVKQLASCPFPFQVALNNPLFGKGARIQLMTSKGLLEGDVKDIDQAGKLYIVNSQGETVVLTSGECSMIRRIDRRGEL